MVAGWIAAAVLVAACASLGTWQLRRMHAKQARLDAVAALLQERESRPLSLAADAGRATDYDWASGTGHYALLPAVVLDNQLREGRAGVMVYRLFLPDAGDALLVEWGWLAMPGNRLLPRIDAAPEGERRITGLLLPPPSAGMGEAATSRQGPVLLTTQLRPADIAATLSLSVVAPRVLRLDPADPEGYARDLDILPNTLLPQQHLGYAVQWFALGLLGLAIATILTYRARRQRHD